MSQCRCQCQMKAPLNKEEKQSHLTHVMSYRCQCQMKAARNKEEKQSHLTHVMSIGTIAACIQPQSVPVQVWTCCTLTVPMLIRVTLSSYPEHYRAVPLSNCPCLVVSYVPTAKACLCQSPSRFVPPNSPCQCYYVSVSDRVFVRLCLCLPVPMLFCVCVRLCLPATMWLRLSTPIARLCLCLPRHNVACICPCQCLLVPLFDRGTV